MGNNVVAPGLASKHRNEIKHSVRVQFVFVIMRGCASRDGGRLFSWSAFPCTTLAPPSRLARVAAWMTGRRTSDAGSPKAV